MRTVAAIITVWVLASPAIAVMIGRTIKHYPPR